MRKKKIKNNPPGSEARPDYRGTYRAYSWRIGKERAIKNYKIRYGADPKECFFGPPNGSMIYAGPIHPIDDTGSDPGQPCLL